MTLSPSFHTMTLKIKLLFCYTSSLQTGLSALFLGRGGGQCTTGVCSSPAACEIIQTVHTYLKIFTIFLRSENLLQLVSIIR